MKPKLFTRNFTFLILGQVSSLMGNYTLHFALSMYVLETTGSASVFASLLAVAMLPTILLSPFGGILADRANRRNIMVGLDALSGTVVLAAWALLAQGREILVIGGLMVALSVLGAFESPTVQACVPQMLSGGNLIKGNAVVNQVSALAGLVTPFLGSLFYTAFGIGPVFAAAVLCFFLTAALECGIRLPYEKPQTKQTIQSILREDLTVSMRFLWKDKPAIGKLLLLAALASTFVAGTIVVGFPYLVRTVLGLSAEHYGLAESAMGAAAVLGSLAVGILGKRLRLRNLPLIFSALGICLVPAGLAFLLPVGVWGRYGVLVVMFGACQFGCSIFSTYAISVIQEWTPDHLMGKVMSYVFTLAMCAQPLGQMVYGVLFDWFSSCVFWVLIPSGVLLTAIGLASGRFFRRMEADAPAVRP